MTSLSKLSIHITCLATVFLCAFCAYAYSEKSYSEEYIKALYVIRLPQFVYWQHNPNVYDVCIVGSDEFGATLVQIAAQLDMHKKLNIKQKNLVSDFSECEILYISQYSEFELSQILYKVKSQPILSVSDVKNFIDQGGIVRLVITDDTVKLEINNANAQKRRLVLDSKLLELAERVY